MKNKKKIQIFYGGFKFVKGGVNSHSLSLKQELEKNYNVSLITLDNLSIIVRFLPHVIEKIVNFFNLPLGFYYKGIFTKFLFKIFFNKNCDYRIFEDIYISWNSNIPSLTMLHAVWSDNLQRYKITKKILQRLKEKEISIINKIDHPACTVSEPYKEFIIKKHFSKNLKKELSVIELGIKKEIKIKKKFFNQKSLIYVGTLEARKNVFFLLKVFKKIYEYDSAYSLTIIGDGPDKDKLIKYKNLYNLNVNFLGNKNQNEIFQELKKHKFYIHTSIKESFSLSLLEAKISGLITVAYSKLEVPKEFIDIKINNFNINSWFTKIIQRKNLIKKIDIKKYLLKNTAKKLINKTSVFDIIKKSFFNKISLKELNKVKKKYNLPNKFIINVGFQDKKRDYETLIKAINILKNEIIDIKLIIVRQNNNEAREIQKLINNLQLNLNIKIISNLNHFELACFYKLANMFVSTTINKKMKIPIYESIASNLPMILNNNEFCRRVTENKFMYYDQFDPLSIANKIRFVLSNNKIQKEMVRYEKRRSKISLTI